jgi:hypothetical protein
MNNLDGMKELNKVRLKAILGYGLMILGFFAGGILMVRFMSPLFFMAGIAVMILGGAIAAGTTKKYQSIYKELYVKRPLEENFEKLTYDWMCGFTQNSVQSFQLCEMGNRFYSEDFVQAVWQRTPFEMSDVNVTFNSPGNGRGHKIYFQGRILVFDIPEMHTGSIQIFSANFLHKAINPAATQLARPAEANGFAIFAVNPQEAQTLLTPQLMQGLTYLSGKFHSIAVHMNDTKVAVALADNGSALGSAFDAKHLFAKNSDQEEMVKIGREINDIKEIISIFYNGLSGPVPSNNIAPATLLPGGFLVEHKANVYTYTDKAL